MPGATISEYRTEDTVSIIRSFSVGHGDMFYIRHNADSFTMIDCCLPSDRRSSIVDELIEASDGKSVVRLFSTHPDEDHLRGLAYLDARMEIPNFYCVGNAATKEDESDDFRYYCDLRDSDRASHIYRHFSRLWLNDSSKVRGSAGLSVVWPVTTNAYYREALAMAESGGSPNNISTVLKYALEDGARVLWMGDLETDFMDDVADAVKWPEADIVFAPHHGRWSGRIPYKLLEQINPKLIVLGEAPSEHLHYYDGWDTITQNSAGEIWMDCLDGVVRIYVSNPDYEVDFLDQDGYHPLDGYYLGALKVG